MSTGRRMIQIASRNGLDALPATKPSVPEDGCGPGGACGRHQGRGKHKPGNDAGDEEPANRLLGHRAVDDHGDARGDENAQASRHRHQAGGVLGVITPSDHLRDQDRTDRDGGGSTRPRDGGEEGTGADGHGRQPAAPVPDQRLRG